MEDGLVESGDEEEVVVARVVVPWVAPVDEPLEAKLNRYFAVTGMNSFDRWPVEVSGQL